MKLNTKNNDCAVSDERELRATVGTDEQSHIQLEEHLNTTLVSKIQHSHILYEEITFIITMRLE